LPQLGLPRRFAMDSFPRYSGGLLPQHFILSLLGECNRGWFAWKSTELNVCAGPLVGGGFGAPLE
jgi:hypothetical protein